MICDHNKALKLLVLKLLQAALPHVRGGRGTWHASHAETENEPVSWRCSFPGLTALHCPKGRALSKCR